MQVIMHTIDFNCINFLELSKEPKEYEDLFFHTIFDFISHNLRLRHHMNTVLESLNTSHKQC